MPPVFQKLQLKDQREILVLDAPESFEPELAALTDVRVARHADDVEAVDFVLAFVTTPDQVDAAAKVVTQKAPGDALVWFAYPKASSNKLESAINRDTGWAPLGEAGFEPVRQVAIDEDWSALRFRRVQFIKRLTRSKSFAVSEEGKARAEG